MRSDISYGRYVPTHEIVVEPRSFNLAGASKAGKYVKPVSVSNSDNVSTTTQRRMMMKLALLTTLLAGATAFAPPADRAASASASASTALNGAFDSEIGAASPELGCWDPLGYVTDGDQKRFDHLRGVELKHGRIAMLATWGYATTWSGARFPGCEDFPAGHEVR